MVANDCDDCVLDERQCTTHYYTGDDPSLPTRYPPGTEGKIRVMTLRLSLGLPIHVEGDAKLINNGELSGYYRQHFYR